MKNQNPKRPITINETEALIKSLSSKKILKPDNFPVSSTKELGGN
jgi:hypothetical protein